MFTSRIISATKAARGVRFNSTAAKATAAASGVVSKASGKFYCHFLWLSAFRFLCLWPFFHLIIPSPILKNSTTSQLEILCIPVFSLWYYCYTLHVFFWSFVNSVWNQTLQTDRRFHFFLMHSSYWLTTFLPNCHTKKQKTILISFAEMKLTLLSCCLQDHFLDQGCCWAWKASLHQGRTCSSFWFSVPGCLRDPQGSWPWCLQETETLHWRFAGKLQGVLYQVPCWNCSSCRYLLTGWNHWPKTCYWIQAPLKWFWKKSTY